MTRYQLYIVGGSLLLSMAFFVLAEFLIIKYNGSVVAAPSIPRQPQLLGSGPDLKYVVMGDSTSIGQGTEYTNSYAVAGARHLAQNRLISFINLGASGARVQDVLDSQLAQATDYKPDIVLLAVGANDATHFTSGMSIRNNLRRIVESLRAANCDTRVIVTGSPAMGSIPRFPWPFKQLMGLRTRQINKVYVSLVDSSGLTLAPIAVRTGPAFLADPTLFAADKFHPNTRGYALWVPVVNQALDSALKLPVNHHCQK